MRKSRSPPRSPRRQPDQLYINKVRNITSLLSQRRMVILQPYKNETTLNEFKKYFTYYKIRYGINIPIDKKYLKLNITMIKLFYQPIFDEINIVFSVESTENNPIVGKNGVPIIGVREELLYIVKWEHFQQFLYHLYVNNMILVF